MNPSFTSSASRVRGPAPESSTGPSKRKTQTSDTIIHAHTPTRKDSTRDNSVPPNETGTCQNKNQANQPTTQTKDKKEKSGPLQRVKTSGRGGRQERRGPTLLPSTTGTRDPYSVRESPTSGRVLPSRDQTRPHLHESSLVGERTGPPPKVTKPGLWAGSSRGRTGERRPEGGPGETHTGTPVYPGPNGPFVTTVGTDGKKEEKSKEGVKVRSVEKKGYTVDEMSVPSDGNQDTQRDMDVETGTSRVSAPPPEPDTSGVPLQDRSRGSPTAPKPT